MHILILEDDQSVSDMLKTLFIILGYEKVVIMKTVESALKSIENNHYDFIVSDYNLEDTDILNGHLFEKLRIMGCQAKIVVTSGTNDYEQLKEKMLEAGASLVLKKPYNVEDIEKSIPVKISKAA